jgi:hypothetical protein
MRGRKNALFHGLVSTHATGFALHQDLDRWRAHRGVAMEGYLDIKLARGTARQIATRRLLTQQSDSLSQLSSCPPFNARSRT